MSLRLRKRKQLIAGPGVDVRPSKRKADLRRHMTQSPVGSLFGIMGGQREAAAGAAATKAVESKMHQLPLDAAGQLDLSNLQFRMLKSQRVSFGLLPGLGGNDEDDQKEEQDTLEPHSSGPSLSKGNDDDEDSFDAKDTVDVLPSFPDNAGASERTAANNTTGVKRRARVRSDANKQEQATPDVVLREDGNSRAFSLVIILLVVLLMIGVACACVRAGSALLHAKYG
mmetsp:Transcript_21175/g.42599  ORF Transcript_21175/g.42599 Transcript_21175/m.42599 type:complete len:227 (+) Transcript_21175:116-796(+)